MFTANQIIAHLVGDFLLQSHWMAKHKTKSDLPAIIHAHVYTLPFLFLTDSVLALFVICFTHFLIDRYRLARYVIWFKNGARGRVTNTGFPDDVPVWMSTWLFIITDNVLHILINGLALTYL